MAVPNDQADPFNLDALADSDRFRLFGFTRRDDYVAYLWVLRAMDRSDYLAAVGPSGAGVELVGRPVDTPWDPGLRAAMHTAGRAVYEETVAGQLLADLREHGMK